MSLSEKSSDRYFSMRLSAPSENALLAAIAVCFIVLHVIALVVSAPARQSDAAAPPVLSPLSRGD
jgi:hypothetical protein